MNGDDAVGMIKRVRFTPVRIHEGYEMDDVDRFLDQLQAEAGRGGDLAALVRSATFGRVRLREGYDIGEVDDFLREVSGITVESPATPAPPVAPDSTAWAIRGLVERVRFTPVRLREGYDMAQVDQLLDKVVEAAERGEPIAAVIHGAHFTPVRMREGYDMGEVDDFLAQLTNPDPASFHPDLVQEHPSLIDRLRRRL